MLTSQGPELCGAAIEIDGLSRVYGDGASMVIALENVNLTIEPSRLLAVLGPSGCGKSTLLNIVAGFDRPTSGRVLVDGRSREAHPGQRGVVFQDSAALFPWMSVEENVGFGLRNRSLPRARIASRVEDALELVGLNGFGDKYPHMLSGGMRQLAAIARVLVLEPLVMLMDEPFGALDALTRQRMQARLVEIWGRTKVTIIFITHSVDEAIFLGDDVVVMSPRPGRILKQMPVRLSRPRDVTSPGFNALKAEALDLLGVLAGEGDG